MEAPPSESPPGGCWCRRKGPAARAAAGKGESGPLDEEESGRWADPGPGGDAMAAAERTVGWGGKVLLPGTASALCAGRVVASPVLVFEC